MIRNYILSLLSQYKPTPPEIDAKERIITFVQQYPDCFERTQTFGHITASAWLLNNKKTHALLMHHAKLNMWVQLGGHCDGNSRVLDVAIKEAQEESGIMGIAPIHENIFDIDVHLIPETVKEKAHYHYDIRFLLQVTSNENFVKNNESKELRWINKNPRMLPTQELSVIRMFQKWVSL